MPPQQACENRACHQPPSLLTEVFICKQGTRYLVYTRYPGSRIPVLFWIFTSIAQNDTSVPVLLFACKNVTEQITGETSQWYDNAASSCWNLFNCLGCTPTFVLEYLVHVRTYSLVWPNEGWGAVNMIANLRTGMTGTLVQPSNS